MRVPAITHGTLEDLDDGDGWDDPDDESMVACPYCRREILEDTPRCPWCERYISAEDQAGPGRPVWVVVTAVLCLAIAIWWVVF